jgi:hypothetical protein
MTKPKAPPGTEPRHCDVCGRALRYGNTSGICSGAGSTPACKRERINRDRIAAGLLPHKRRENAPPPGELISVRAGETYNSWTVLEDGAGVLNKVRCRCGCGIERPVMIASLTEGKSKSCGRRCEARRAANPYLLPGTYGQLEVLETALRSKNMVRVHCNRCGADTTKRAGMIKTGRTTTCGCGMGKFTHGLSRHPLYDAWDGMRDRCTNPRATGYKDWGGRGITVCAGWQGAPDGFLSFAADMGERPSPSHTVDRKDNDGGYWCGHCAECVRYGRPSNCQWATKKQQALNRRSAAKVTQKLNAALAEVERLNRLLASPPRKRRLPEGDEAQEPLF